jgi:hypothetical protein
MSAKPPYTEIRYTMKMSYRSVTVEPLFLYKRRTQSFFFFFFCISFNLTRGNLSHLEELFTETITHSRNAMKQVGMKIYVPKSKVIIFKGRFLLEIKL